MDKSREYSRESGEGNWKGFESRQAMIACPRVSELKVGLYCRVEELKK
jgi:hypothetical protein